MTKLLEQAVERLRALPSDQQDELARMLLRLADADQEPVALSDGERAAIATSKAAAARGEFATDEEVQSVWASYGL
jgi:predicted transcriptional regulator